jgi:hypothetical protein
VKIFGGIVASLFGGIFSFALSAALLSMLLIPAMSFVAGQFNIYDDTMLRSLVAFGVLFASLALGLMCSFFIWMWVQSSD